MIRKFAFILLLFFAAVLPVHAGKIHCRSGIITAAELSRADIKITNLGQHGFPVFPAEKVYAVLTIVPGNMRAISIFDHTLSLYGVDYPCVGILRNGKFEYYTGEVKSTSPLQLIFILDGKAVAASGQVEIFLKSNLGDESVFYDTPVPFEVIGKKLPTAPGKIPANGLLKVELVK